MRDAASSLPDPRVCEQARLSRDPRFDGLFFTAVTSTGIYCRSVCPVRSPKRENIRYYPTAAAAEADGFRPCLRCRPELAPGDTWLRGDATVARALKLIEDGFLAERRLPALADRVGVGERHLRRLFVERLGATPPSVHRTRRLLFAKQLLTETSLPITEVALEAGFGSLRRFNACFREAYGMAPRTVRRRPRRARARDEVLELRLAYRPPYPFAALLEHLRAHALPGVEVVDGASYARVLGPIEAPGWLRVSAWPRGGHALCLELHCQRSTRVLDVVTRVRRMFDLDADPETVDRALAQDELLRPLVERDPGLRLAGAWSGWEAAVLAVLAREEGPEAARGLAGRLAEEVGAALDGEPAPGLDRLFPTAAAVLDADLTRMGLSPRQAAALRAVVGALSSGCVDLRRERTLDELVGLWTSVPGVDSRMAHEIAWRALGQADAFPVDGRTASRAAAWAGAGGVRTLRARAESWRPWRAYGVLHLRRAPARG